MPDDEQAQQICAAVEIFMFLKWNRLRRFLVVAVLCAGPMELMAQTTTESSQKAKEKLNEPVLTSGARLADIVVRADVPGSLTSGNAAMARQELSRIPGGAGVIVADDYKRGRVSTLKDALDFSPGVTAQPRFGSDEARLSIRGSGVQRTFHGRGLSVLQDGMAINLADGGFDMQALEPLSADHIDVYRGANALQYGAATLGGAINYSSPTGYTASPFQSRAEMGSFGYLRGQLSSGQVLGEADYYASLSHTSQEGFRDQSQQNNQRFFGNFGTKINPDLENRIYFTYAQTQSELPGSLTKAQMETNPQSANPANVLGDQQRNFHLTRLGDKLTYAWDEQRLETTLFWSYKDLFHPIFQVIDQTSNDFGIGLRYVNEKEFLGNRNILTSGINLRLGVVEDSQFINVAGRRGTKTLDDTQTATQTDLYFQNQHYLTEQLSLVLGFQAVFAGRDVEVDLGPAATRSAYQEYTAWNPKLGLLYDLDRQTALYTNVSRSYEPPSFSEMRNTQLSAFSVLDAQSAWTAEIGTRGERGIFAWDFSFYHAWVEDEYLALNDGSGAALGTINATATRHLGIELGFNTEIARGLIEEATADHEADSLVLKQIYNWGRYVFDSDPVYGDNQLAGLPEHVYRAELVYRHPCGFYIGPNVEWSIRPTPVDFANTYFADAYALVGMKAGYQSKKGFSVFVDARNLTDQIYAATTGVVADAKGADTAQFLPGDRLSVYGGLEWRY